MADSKESVNQEYEDDYTKAIGEIGKWQILLFLITVLPVRIVLANAQFGIVFMAPKTTYRCVERENSTELGNMTCYNDCLKYEYFSDFQSTIIEDWDLVCDRAWLADFTQTVCMFGILVGNAVFGFISDRYGRRLTLIVSGTLETCMSFVMPFCPDLWSFLMVRFILGGACGGTAITSFVLLMEIFGPKKRNLLGFFFMFPIALGYLLMAVIAFYFRSWRRLSIALAIPSLIFVTYIFYLPESPKWLISFGRLEEATAVMTTAATWNKLPTNDMKEKVERIAKAGVSTDKSSKRNATFKDLIILPSLRTKNLCSCLIWFSCGLSYYGVYQYFGQTSSNIFLSFALVALIQIPGFMLAGYVSNIFGRRMAVSIFFIISAIGNGILALPDEWYYVKLVAGTIGASGGAATFSVVYVYTAELFPTVARNMGMGASSTANRVGSMLAPFLSGLRTSTAWLPPAVFAAVPVVGVLACWCLPETRGKKLEDHLEDDHV